MFLLVGKSLANLQFEAVNNLSSKSAANLGIYRNISKNVSLEIAPSENKNTFPKLFSQKINCKIFYKKFAFKKHIFKIYLPKRAPSKNAISKFFLKIFFKQINLISLIYSLSESSDTSEKGKSLKLSLICFF